MAVVLVGLGTIAIKAAGPVAIGGRTLPPRVMGLVSALAPALLAALVATQVFGGDHKLVVDERVLGIGVAGLLIVLRVPVLGVVVAAAVVTALARAV